MRRLIGVLPLAALLVIWQLVGSADSPYLPPPSTWWTAVQGLHAQGSLLPAVVVTIETFAMALAAALVLGSVVGLAIGSSPRVRRAAGPLLEFCRAMPPPAVVPVAVLLIGFGQTVAVVVVVFTAMWPIVLNTAEAVQSLHPVLLESNRSLHLPVGVRLRKVYAPAVLPGILLGVRVAAPVCVIVTLLVEMLTAADGIGMLLLQAQRNFVSAQAFALLAVVGVFGFLVNAGVVLVERRVLRAWPPRGDSL
ncbi:ABC transporter permease [Allokutzneria sp. NRRL B-24872]|uniref:ABC transporter permease n=1 Tax=Allokutzneria sp. NRRL B-24872 TaxID=1137961 RepID=UPI000A362A40|nr:ABC transporter permease subunit [Allokutzneria sp. NRRL B-24872]